MVGSDDMNLDILRCIFMFLENRAVFRNYNLSVTLQYSWPFFFFFFFLPNYKKVELFKIPSFVDSSIDCEITYLITMLVDRHLITFNFYFSPSCSGSSGQSLVNNRKYFLYPIFFLILDLLLLCLKLVQPLQRIHMIYSGNR